jgi:tryptophan synthase beta subunit
MSELIRHEDAYAFIKPTCSFRTSSFAAQGLRGRPSLLYFAKKMTEISAGENLPQPRRSEPYRLAQDNNVPARSCLPQMGKTRVIAETGAVQHGVATVHRSRLAEYGMRKFMG